MTESVSRTDGDQTALSDTALPSDLHEDVVEVRRSAGVLALVTVGAATLAVLYAVRAFASTPLLGLIALVLGVIAVMAGRAWYDARSPLLVADGLGVRVRHGDAWRGLPWAEVDHVVLDEPHGVLRDGSLDVVAVDGTAYVVPLGLTTRASHDDLGHAFGSLSGDDRIVVRSERTVRAVTRRPSEDTADVAADHTSVADSGEPGGSAEPATSEASQPAPSAPPTPVSSPAATSAAGPVVGGGSDGDHVPSGPARIDLGLTASVGSSALAPGYRVVTALRADRGRPELVIDRPVDEPRTSPPTAGEIAASSAAKTDTADASAVGETRDGGVEPADADQPSVAEVVRLGALLRTARERVGVTVDDLATRTQIRPHIIEGLEDDDTEACGGDFYARGHLRSIARALGTDPEPWLEAYDASYARAPVPARAVFEAERATGAQSIRIARGGRNWLALVVAVLVLAIIWGVGQLVVGGDSESPSATVPTEVAPPPSDPDAMTALGAPATNHLVLRGKKKKPTKVVVADARGKTVWSGDLAKGEFRRVSVVGPAKVTVKRADGVTVAVNGRKARALGDGSDKASATVGDS